MPSHLRVAIPRPGITEQALVVLTTFILIHQLPNVWFLTSTDLAAGVTNPLAILAQFGLMVMAIARIVGSIDYLITAVKAELMMYTFALVVFLTTFWSADPAETMEKAILFIAVSLYGAYLVIRFPLHQILKLLAIMFSGSAVINLAFAVGLPLYGVSNLGEFTGVFHHKNGLGFFAALAIPILVAAGRTSRGWQLPFYGAAAMEVVLLVGSQSKTMLVAGLGPTVLMGFFHLFRGRRTLRGAVIMSLVGTGVFTALFTLANIALLAEVFDKDVSLTGRVPLWESLLPVAQDRLLIGHGYRAAFGGFFSPVHEVLVDNPWLPTHAHNAVIQITMELGLLGLIPFLISYVRGVSRSIQVVAMVPGAVGLWPLSFFTTTLLVSITESGVTYANFAWLLYVVAALSVSLYLKHRSELGLSTDLRTAIEANHQQKAVSRATRELPVVQIPDGDTLRT